MSDGTVAKYDPARLMDAVRDRIKAEFVGLIPDDTWKQMVAAEVKAFMDAGPRRNHYDDRPTPSGFQRTVWEELEKETKARLKAYFDSEEWTGVWDGQKRNASAAVRTLVADKIGEIMQSILGVAIQSTIEGMRARL